MTSFFGGGGGGADDAAEEARRREEERQARIAEGTQRINTTFDSRFNPGFFQQRFQTALDFWMPQLQKQFTDSQRQLTLALSRAGQLNSSVRGEKFADLEEQFDLQSQAIQDRARGLLNEEKANIERSRSGLISQLSSTADASAAAQQANNQARLLSAPASFEPLEQVFVDVTSGLASVADAERRRRESLGAQVFGRPSGGSSFTVGT